MRCQKTLGDSSVLRLEERNGVEGRFRVSVRRGELPESVGGILAVESYRGRESASAAPM